MRETDETDHAVRTRLNVRDCTATLILKAGERASAGTDLTREEADKRKRELRVFDVDDPKAKELIVNWLRGIPRMHVLNVAGPREGEAPGIYDKSRKLLREVLVDFRMNEEQG